MSSPGTVRATYDPFDPPALPAEVYLALLSHCAPAWDPMDRNIYTPDGFSLNDVDPATRTSFVDTWQLDAWPRWRWEVNCLQGAFTPGGTLPAGAVGAPAGAVGSPAGAAGTPADAVGTPAGLDGPRSPPESTEDPDDPSGILADLSDSHRTGRGRGARTADCHSGSDRGQDRGISRPAHMMACSTANTSARCGAPPARWCRRWKRSTPSRRATGRQPRGRCRDHGGNPSVSATSGSGRFAGYHFPHLRRPNDDGTSTCHINPEWPVLEYRNGEYYRCKSLSPDGRGVGCVRY